MQKAKVQIVPNDMGAVIRVSKNNPEFGHVRLTQTKVTFTATGWVKKTNLSTLLHGKVEDLEAMGIQNEKELSGNIVIQEQVTPFSESDPDRDLKIAGETGIICCNADGEPIYRKTMYDGTGSIEDTLVAHANGQAIREANTNTSGANDIAADEFDKAVEKGKKSSKKTKEEPKVEVTEDVVIEDQGDDLVLEDEDSSDDFDL